MVISGDLAFKRNREIQKATMAAQMTGRRVEWLDGSDPECINDMLMGNIFFDEKILAFIDTPDKALYDPIRAHEKSKSKTVTLVVVYPKNIRSKGTLDVLVQDLPKGRHISFPSPKPWEFEDYATKFCVGEAKRLGKDMSENLARAVVRACGDDLGFLSFEVQKIAAYLDALGESVVAPAHIRPLIAPFTAANVFPVVEALASLDTKRLVKTLHTVKRTHNNDPTMFVCAIVGATAVKWLQALALHEAGLPSKVAADQMGVSEFRFDRTLIPAGKRWGEQGLSKLVRGITDVERSVRKGKISPWIMLESRLASLCNSVRKSG
jgi:DNA polymerase III delta subunit